MIKISPRLNEGSVVALIYAGYAVSLTFVVVAIVVLPILIACIVRPTTRYLRNHVGFVLIQYLLWAAFLLINGFVLSPEHRQISSSMAIVTFVVMLGYGLFKAIKREEIGIINTILNK